MSTPPVTPDILRFFAYGHLPPAMQVVSRPFHDLAHEMVSLLPPSAELSAGLRKLLEAKDCAVRAAMPLPGAPMLNPAPFRYSFVPYSFEARAVEAAKEFVKHSPDQAGGFDPPACASPRPVSDNVLARALLLARISLAFGRVERITRHEDGSRPETDTDHTVMLGLVACELAPANLDRAKIAAFALVHDIVEVYAGDTPTLAISLKAMAAKAVREDAARIRLVTELGDESWLAALLATYEQQREPEARFVRLIDKVLPKLTHAFNGCIAAQSITDRDGFVDAHARQLQHLREEYPEFPDTLEPSQVSMLYAEECWPLAELPPGGAP